MEDRYLKKKDIAAMLEMSPDMAASFLRKNGLAPIDLGPGKGKGYRWLESEVQRVMRQAFNKVQPKPRKPRPPAIPDTNGRPLAECSNSLIAELVEKNKKDGLTPCRIVQ